MSGKFWERIRRIRHALAPSILSFAVVFQFALLPILWENSRGSASFIWTVTSAGLMLFAAIVCRADRYDSRALTLVLLGFFASYLLFAWLSFQMVGVPSQERFDYLLYTLQLLPLAAIYYLFGVVVGGRQPIGALTIAIAISSLYTFASMENYTQVGLYKRSLAGFNITYQYSGDAFAIAALLLIGLTRNAGLRLGLMILTIVILFIIPSRSSAVVGVASMLIWAFFYFKHKLPVLGGLCLCLFVAWQYGWLSPESIEEAFAGTRFDTMVSGKEDSSKAARDDIAEVGVSSIQENFLIGYFGFQIDRLGSEGDYIHSALDIWAQTGVIPFAVFVAMWFWLFYKIASPSSHVPRHRERFVGVLLFSLLSWIVARSPSAGVLYIPLGIASACLAGRGLRGVRTAAAARSSVADMPGHRPVDNRIEGSTGRRRSPF